jgi:hypothetical protein
MIYQGGCHCGAVRFQVDLALYELKACNCSICSNRGHLLAFAPASSFQLEKGEDAQTNYQLGKKRIHHLFCKTCGVASFSRGIMPDGSGVIAINAGCLEGVDLGPIPVKAFDGKSL